ncbi:MAG: MOP flippase family protein [Candidatus Atribacteria bacterium]|nr:MOP flippase family protein [Candidatus Atribacteria bacterium]
MNSIYLETAKIYPLSVDNLKNKIFSGLAWSGTGQIVQQATQFIIGVILARLLSPRDFGLIAMIIVFTGFAEIFKDLGLGSAIIQKKGLENDHLNSIFWVNIITGLLLTGVIIGLSEPIASFYNEPKLKKITIVISLNFFIASLSIVNRSILRKNMSFKQIANIQILAIIIPAMIAIIMALKGFGVWSLVFRSIISTSITTLLFWTYSPFQPTFSFNKDKIKELIGYSSNLLGFNLFNYWARNFDNLLIGKFISSAALGIYSRAYALMLLPITQLSMIVSQVMFPALSSIQDDNDRIKKIYLKATRCIALITFPLMTGLLVVSEPFILVIYGNKWSEVVPILQILCMIGLVQSVGTTVGWIYTSQGRTDIMLKWGIFAGIFRVFAFIIGLQWGVIGVASSYVISTSLLLYPGWTIPGRLINMRFTEMLKNLSATIYCSTIMGLAVWALGFFILKGMSPLWILVIQITFGAFQYIVLIHILKVKAFKEVIELFRDNLAS